MLKPIRDPSIEELTAFIEGSIAAVLNGELTRHVRLVRLDKGKKDLTLNFFNPMPNQVSEGLRSGVAQPSFEHSTADALLEFIKTNFPSLSCHAVGELVKTVDENGMKGGCYHYAAEEGGSHWMVGRELMCMITVEDSEDRSPEDIAEMNKAMVTH